VFKELLEQAKDELLADAVDAFANATNSEDIRALRILADDVRDVLELHVDVTAHEDDNGDYYWEWRQWQEQRRDDCTSGIRRVDDLGTVGIWLDSDDDSSCASEWCVWCVDGSANDNGADYVGDDNGGAGVR
jgi:hypothetical protein